jgi:hypothetical protein
MKTNLFSASLNEFILYQIEKLKNKRTCIDRDTKISSEIFPNRRLVNATAVGKIILKLT